MRAPSSQQSGWQSWAQTGMITSQSTLTMPQLDQLDQLLRPLRARRGRSVLECAGNEKKVDHRPGNVHQFDDIIFCIFLYDSLDYLFVLPIPSWYSSHQDLPKDWLPKEARESLTCHPYQVTGLTGNWRHPLSTSSPRSAKNWATPRPEALCETFQDYFPKTIKGSSTSTL